MKLLRNLKLGYVAIKPEREEVVTESGIVLSAETLEDKQRKIRPTGYGEVVAIASDVTDCKVADRVLYSTWAPVILTEGEGEDKIEYHVVDQHSVLALIE